MGKTAQRASDQRLDRWGTLNAFTEARLAGLTATTRSPSAGVVWFVLFSLANGRTGLVRGASISRLARLTGLARFTVRRSIRALLEAGALSVHDRAGGVPVYELDHVLRDDDGPE